MSKYSNTVEYKIRTTLDNTGIAKLQAELTQLTNQVTLMGSKQLMNSGQVTDTLAKIKKIQNALTQAFNPKLGMLNTSSFMKNVGMSMNDMYNTFKNIGPSGERAFASMYGQLTKIDTGMRSISKTSDKIMNTLGNTVRWGLIASGFAAIMNSVHQAATYVKDLDRSLTNIMMVSGETRENMNNFAKDANEVAQRLGGTTVQMTEATKVFIQQGYSLKESSQLGEYAVHLANVSEQDSATASDEITAYMNAFKIPLDNLGNAISKWAAVANATAVDVEELSIASQKAASVAATVGVDLDQFAGHIAAIESVTREAPENIGNGLKTIYSRIADISLGKTLDDDVNLGSFSKALQKVGVDVLDSTGKLRDAGAILEDLMVVWQDLDQTQRAAVAKTVAGRFQLARFEALMNRADIYENAANISRAESGTTTYDRMQETYRNSLEGRTKALQASVEQIFLGIFTTDSFYGVIDALQTFVDVINKLIDVSGGGTTVLLGLVAALGKLGSTTISRGISNFIQNQQANAEGNKNIFEQQRLAKQQLIGQGLMSNNAVMDKAAMDIASVNQYSEGMNAETRAQANKLIEERISLIKMLSQTEEQQVAAEERLRAALAAAGVDAEATTAAIIAQIEALERDGVQITATGEAFEQLRNLVTQTNWSFSEFLEKLKNPNFRLTKNEVTQIANALQNLVEKEIFVGEEAANMQKAINILNKISNTGASIGQLEKALDKAGISFEQFKKTVGKAGINLRQLDAALRKVDATTRESIMAVLQAKEAHAGLTATIEINSQAFAKLAYGGYLQSIANQAINLGMGITQLAFSVSMLKNLGSIWTNEDTEIPEKIADTLLNIAIVAPMLLMGVQQMTQGYQTLKTTVTSLKEQYAALNLIEAANIPIEETKITLTAEQIAFCEANKISQEKYAAALALVRAGEYATVEAALAAITARATEITVTELLTKAVVKLKAALMSLALNPVTLGIIGVVAAIGLVAAAIQGYDESIKNSIKNTGETIEKNGKELQKSLELKPDLEKFKELIGLYRQGKTNSDELKTAADKINESLDDQNLKVLAAAGYWNSYALALEKATEKQKDKILADAMTNFGSAGYNVQNSNDFGQKASRWYNNPLSPLSTVLSTTAGPIKPMMWEGDPKTYLAVQRGLATLNSAQKHGSIGYAAGTWSVDGWADAKEIMEDAKAVDEAFQQVLETLDSASDEYATIREFYTSFQGQVTGSDWYKNYSQGQQQVIDAAVLRYQDTPELKYNIGESIEDYTNRVRDITKIYDEEILEGVVEGLALGTSDSSQALSKQLSFEKAYDTAKESAEQKFEDIEKNNKKPSEYKEEILEGIEYIKNLAVSEEEKINFFDLINWEDTDQKIAEQMQKIRENAESAQPLSAKELLGPKIQTAQDYAAAIDNITYTDLDANKKLNVEDSTQVQNIKDNYERIVELNNEGMNAKGLKEWREELDKTKKSLDEEHKGLLRRQKDGEDVSQALADYNKKVEKLHSDEEDYQKALTNLSLRYAESADALEKLNESMEDWEETLNSGNEKEKAKAFQEIAETLGHLMNLDASTFDVQYITDNLDDIKLAAEGDIDALMRLRRAAAEKILVDAGLTDEAGQIPQELADILDWAQMIASDNTIEAGAELDTSQVMAALMNMLQAGKITADQLDAMLQSISGMGIVPDYDTGHLMQLAASDNPLLAGAATAMVYGIKWRKIGNTDSNFTANLPSSSGKGSGGGGGGSGSKGKDIKPIEEKEVDIDPYQKVNAELEKLADEYTEVDKAKDRMYGDRYRRAQEQEIKNLQKQNEKLEERVKISEKLIEAYRTGQDNPEYGIYLNGESFAKYGFTDEDLDGIIDNPWDRIEELRKDYYAKVEAANAYAGEDRSEEDQAEFERLSAIADEAHELWSGAQNFADEYQEAWDKVRDDTQQIRENMYEIEDKIIDVWNYAKDAAKELGEFREDQIDLAETLATLWGDDAVKSLGFAFDRFTNMFEANEKSLADAIIDYQNRLNKATDENMKQWYQDQIDLAQKAMANGTSVLDLNMQRMNEIYKAIDEWKDSGRSELFGSNEKAMWEAFDEAWEDAVDYAKKLKGYIEDIHENIGQVMDDMYDAMDRRNDLFDQVDNQYEYLKNMTELVHGEKAYDMLEKVTRKQAQAGEERLKTLEEERKVNHDMLEKLEKGSEEYLQALEKEQELDKDILDVRENIAETYKEAKELANELAVQNWLDNFTGDINGVEVPLEYAADQWERIKENADNYLDDLNRAWELEKLENEYLKLIDDAVDPNIQKQITKQMQEQLGYLREKDKLSEYDVKYANAQLEILQKTIALEDARANKNQMKLRRDSQGNYSYVYAANRNDVRDKENDLLDARMNGYNMSVEASRNATDDYFNQIQNMADKLRSVANDASLSAEQVDAITQDIIDKGYEYLNAKGEQLTTAQRNGIESYIQAAKELSELNAGNVLDMSRQLEEGLVDDLGMVTDTFHTAVKDWVDGETGLAYFRDAADQTGRDLVRNVKDFVIAVGEANTNIEEPLSGIETKFVDTNTALTNLMASAQDFYGFLEEKSGIVGQAAEDLANYQTALTEMNSKMNDYYNAWEQRGKELESEKAINSQLRIDMNNLQEEYETKLAEAQRRAGGGSGGSGSGGSTDTSNGSVVGYSGRYYSDSWGNGPSGNWFADQPGAVRISSFSRRSGYGDYNVHLETLNGGHLGWVKESQLFDTGGYTGAWGPGGKAAILHEKELVLNAQDTQNMLAAVSVVRGLVEMLKGSTFNLNNMSQRGFASNGIGNNVEQRVEITAEFPNVRSAADIETALLNLSNNAYQYAYNKNEKFM